MAQIEFVARLNAVAIWLDALPEVVTCAPDVSDDINFHLNGIEDWREQAAAIVATLDADSLTAKNIGNFDTVEGYSPEVGEVCLFVPAYEESVTNKIDYAELFGAEVRA